jgi:hypothetical protein
MVCPLSGNMAWKQCFLVYHPIFPKKIENPTLSFVIDTTGSKTPTQESEKKQSPGGTTDEISNENYKGTTPPPSRRFSPTSDKMCGKCVMNCETQLPDDPDRDEWPIDKIEHGCFQKMCELIDLYDRSKIPLMSALGCFCNTEADSINQEFKATGGMGIAKKALGRWGTSHRSHNVGALKEILQYTMKRMDVIREIERWEKMSVCHGCGIKNLPNNSDVELNFSIRGNCKPH